MQKEELLKQMSPQERLLFAKVLDAAKSSQKNHKKTTTDFIDKGKNGIFLEKVKYIRDLQVMAFGGNTDCERRMLAFAPEYMHLSEEDFPIKAIHITKNKKFGQKDLSHRDYLGSILGLGIDRSKVGDILLLEEETICYIHQELAEYVCAALQKVSHTNVKTSVSDVVSVILPQKQWQYRTMTVASLRLDAVAGGGFHLSRAKVQALIKGEKVQVNWSTITSPSILLKEGDMISIRGFGRVKLFEIGGMTKKDRICVTVGQEK